MGCFDGMLVKYGAVLVGYAILGLPVFGKGKEAYLKRVGNDASAITRDYIRNSSLLINLAKVNCYLIFHQFITNDNLRLSEDWWFRIRRFSRLQATLVWLMRLKLC